MVHAVPGAFGGLIVLFLIVLPVVVATARARQHTLSSSIAPVWSPHSPRAASFFALSLRASLTSFALTAALAFAALALAAFSLILSFAARALALTAFAFSCFASLFAAAAIFSSAPPWPDPTLEATLRGVADARVEDEVVRGRAATRMGRDGRRRGVRLRRAVAVVRRVRRSIVVVVVVVVVVW
jgi:hypothetical protein